MRLGRVVHDSAETRDREELVKRAPSASCRMREGRHHHDQQGMVSEPESQRATVDLAAHLFLLFNRKLLDNDGGDIPHGSFLFDGNWHVPMTCRVRFLTAQTRESVRRLTGPIRDFKQEHPNTEMRVYPNSNELHDRYVLSRDRMLVVGHGLKDIGGRESFVISIGRSLGRDLLDQVSKQFDTRWSRATPL